MNKRIKNVIALLLAVVTSAILPLSAFAIVYSGGYGGVNYVLNYSGSRTNIPCTLSVDTDSFLYLKTKAYIATNDGEWGYVEQTVNPGKKLHTSVRHTRILAYQGYPLAAILVLATILQE